MPMFNPPHPGEVVRAGNMEPLGLTVTATAAHLGITRKALSEFLNGHSRVSVDMALRLSKAFGGSPRLWLDMQTAFDLWQARGRADEIKVKPIRGEAA